MKENNDLLQQYMLPWLLKESQAFEEFIKFGEKKTYQKGTIIVNQGEKVENIYYLNKGRVKVMLFTDLGEEKLLWYVSEGNILGDVPFFCKLPSYGAIIADEDCEVFVNDNNSLLKAIQSDPKIVNNMFISMAKRISLLINQVEDAAFNNPIIRISKLLYLLSKQFGQKCSSGTELNLTITHKEIATITGLHRVTVTNEINKLKKEGIIKIPKRGHLVITDIEKLYNYAFYIK